MRALSILAATGLIACAFPIPDLDLEAPRVVSSEPVGTAITTPEIVVEFSKPVLRERLEVNNAFVLVKTADITSALLTDLNNPPLIASRQPLVVDGTLTLSEDGTTARFLPTRPLDGETGYTYLVSRSVTDVDENPLVVPLLDEDGEVVRYPEGHPVRPGEIVYVMGHHRVDFVTGTALEVEGPMVEERFPAAGAQNVPPNLASVRVRFNEPAHNVTPATFQVVRPDGSAVGADEVLVTDGRLRAELVLSEALALSTEYRMVLRADIVDGIGNRLDERLNESTFTTAACEDHTPPEVDPASVQVLVADTYAVVSWRTNEPATGRVRFGAGVPTEEVAADSGACRYPNFDPCAEPPPDVECPHSALLEGLTPESLYAFEIENVDLAGNVTTTAAEEFTTSPPLPPLVINELLHGVVAPETAEFVEIYNAGEEEVDLEGWLIRDSSVEDPRTQVLGPFGSYDTVVAPGEYALLVGGAFDPALYPDLAATAILSGRSTTSGNVTNRLLSPGMASTRNIQLQLLTPDEVPVSTFGGWLRGGERRGIAIERIDALEPDVRDNWTWAQDPPGATPGYRNSVATGP